MRYSVASSTAHTLAKFSAAYVLASKKSKFYAWLYSSKDCGLTAFIFLHYCGFIYRNKVFEAAYLLLFDEELRGYEP
jgi:hypothetical protein